MSVFEMFKIGIGPSSSHTLGPWRAAQRFVAELEAEDLLASVTHLRVELLGCLAKTGQGHATDIGLQLGLSGRDPASIDVRQIPDVIADIATTGVAAAWRSVQRAVSTRAGHPLSPRPSAPVSSQCDAICRGRRGSGRAGGRLLLGRRR